MQAVWEEHAPMFFARGADHDYMMRSEKRPGQRMGGQPPRRRRRPKTSPLYIVITLLLLLIAYPIGLVFLWVRKIRWSSFTKLMVSLLTGVLFFVLMAFLLTFESTNPTITRTQDMVKDKLTYVMDAARDAVTNKEKIEYNLMENGPRILVEGAETALLAASKGVPALRDNLTP